MTGEAQELGAKIRAARKELKMTQAELAGTDFTKSFISQVEKGFARPSIRSLQIIAGRLNKPIGFFLNDQEVAPPASAPTKSEHLLQSARSLIRDNHLQDALTVYQDVLASVPKTETGVRARAFTEMSRVLWLLDRKLEAVQALEEGIELYRHGQDPLRRVHALDRLAGYTTELGDRARAVALCEQALTILEEHQVNHQALELKLRVDAGLQLAWLQQPERAKRHLQQAMELAATLDDYYRWGEICHAMGFLYAAEGELEKARDFSLRAVRFYESVEDPVRKLQARVNAASAYHRAGNVQQAWEQAALAQQEADELGDPGLLSEVYRLKGRLAEREEKWAEAAAAYEEGIRHQRDTDGLIPLHRRRAFCLHRLGKLDEAIVSAREAVTLLEKRADTPRDQLAKAYSELALLLKDAGRLEEAQEVSLRSLELFR